MRLQQKLIGHLLTKWRELVNNFQHQRSWLTFCCLAPTGFAHTLTVVHHKRFYDGGTGIPPTLHYHPYLKKLHGEFPPQLLVLHLVMTMVNRVTTIVFATTDQTPPCT